MICQDFQVIREGHVEQAIDKRKSSMNTMNDESKFLFVAASDHYLQWLNTTLGKWDIQYQKPALLPLLLQRVGRFEAAPDTARFFR